MKTVFAALMLLSVCVLTGCPQQAHLYPVKGPLSLQNPAPVFAARFSIGLGLGHQTFSAVLADSESFKESGTMKTGKTRLQDASHNPASSAMSDLASAWDTVYGQGYYVAHVLGSRDSFESQITGSQGTVLQIAMYGDSFGEKGVAQDDKGNIYKLVF
jgi:hypothetical protein